MLIEAGHYALVLALAVCIVQTIVPVWGARRDDAALMEMGAACALASFACVAFSFVALSHAYLVSDFSIRNVVENSHSQKPLIYKLTGVWGNHEGSMLLWVLVLTVFAALVALSRRSLPARLRANALGVQGAIAVAFLLFVLVTSNPFSRLSPAPFEGRDLNPILQDPGLAIHPPLLYIGYVGLSIAFAFALAALIEGRIDAVWARAVRPWTLAAWAFLTLGISMGSYWAYYELGWGGFWFWDPVENASLMPWLAATALLHSVVVMERREALKVWTIFLAILAFSLSLVGTFLVRSGVLTSVHAFATDPGRGAFILGILTVFIGGGLALFAWRAPLLRQGGLFAPISREGALVVNNLLFSTACGTVLIGTLYPLALEAAIGAKISVGPPFFNLTVGAIALPLLLLLPFGQQLAWKRGDALGAAQRLMAAFALAIVAVLATFAFARGGPVLAPIGVGIGAFVAIGAVVEISGRAFGRGVPLRVALSRALGLPRSAWGTAAAHFGVGVTVLGLAAAAWGTETLVVMKPGDRASVGPYVATLERVVPRSLANYREDVGVFALTRADGTSAGTLDASKRLYLTRNMPTTEAGIRTVGLSQIYVSLGEAEPGGIGVRLYYKPFVLLIWIGSLFMAAGGFWAMTDRRFRVGAPVRAAVPQREARA